MALCGRSLRISCLGTFVFATLTAICLYGWTLTEYSSSSSRFSIFGSNSPLASSSGINNNGVNADPWHSNRDDGALALLLRKGVYNISDFMNDVGIVPPYWSNDRADSKEQTSPTAEWGPCFAPNKIVQWDKEIARYKKSGVSYPQAERTPPKSEQEKNDFSNYCRPGFLIIGAGKCGTSSLYHYLTDHPRVLPASEKQIHYFKYYKDASMKWYLRHFPTATSFLASGGLVTGEASPGYLPYPDVPLLIRERLPDGPKIIVVGREPIDRAYSSYKYNYRTPTIDFLKKGRMPGVQRGQPDSYYEPYLFSFEDMMKAELQTLRTCLSKNGTAVTGAREKWGAVPLLQAEFARREKLGFEDMADLDGFCYGDPVNSKVIRRQWEDLMEKYPEKVIENRNVHLKQSFIGRSLYALPLEWWYAVFVSTDIYFVCTEELSDMTGKPMNHLGQFLGLPSYNFSQTVSAGAYNVGGHRGYDKETSWSDFKGEQNPTGETTLTMPLSDALRREVEEFVRPYNERLFNLVGRRCDW